MMRLLLALLSCCVFASFADNRIEEIIDAFREIEQLNLPSELLNNYFEVPKDMRKIRKGCAAEILSILTRSLMELQTDCHSTTSCSETKIKFQNHLNGALGNLSILKDDVRDCPNHRCNSRIGTKEERMNKFLTTFKGFLLRLKQRMC